MTEKARISTRTGTIQLTQADKSGPRAAPEGQKSLRLATKVSLKNVQVPKVAASS